MLLPRALAVPGGGRVAHVSAGYTHTVLRDEGGRVFTLGQNENGQLALGGTPEAAGTAMRCVLCACRPKKSAMIPDSGRRPDRANNR